MALRFDMGIFSVEYYEEGKGNFPVERFILKQDLKMRASIFRVLELLELRGHELREPFSKSLGEGIFELRISCEGKNCRILYFFKTGKRIILTHAFIKKTKKTPPAVIRKAKQRRHNMEMRIKDNV